MPTIADSIKFEKEAPKNVIRLIRDGGFYRAYNHSAWLFQCCIAEYKVTHKYVKSLKEDAYYIGFPENSLYDKIGERQLEKTKFGFDIQLLEDEIPAEDGFETWKTTIKAEYASKSDFNALPLAGADAERAVIKLLREFPLESKSMVECVAFLAELRKMLNNK